MDTSGESFGHLSRRTYSCATSLRLFHDMDCNILGKECGKFFRHTFLDRREDRDIRRDEFVLST